MATNVVDRRRIDEPVRRDIPPDKTEVTESQMPRFPVGAEKCLGALPQVHAKIFVGHESQKILLESVSHGEEGRRNDVRSQFSGGHLGGSA